MNRNELQESYIHQLIDGMDHKTMYQFVYDSLDESLSKYSEAELITEVEEYYPDENWYVRYWVAENQNTPLLENN